MTLVLLVAWLWQGVLIAVVATVATRLVPAGAAAARHAIWWLALLLVVALPAIGFMSQRGPDLESRTSSVEPRAASPEPRASNPELRAPSDEQRASSPELRAPSPEPRVALMLPQPPRWLTPALLALWAATAFFGLARIVVNLVSLRGLKRAAVPLDPQREARLTLWNSARSRRGVVLKVSRQIRGACAVGFTTPTLLVSNELVVTLNDEQLEAIVLHELAHLERRDDWTGLLQRVLVACGGLHLAVRWISRQIDLEREAACDQRVVIRTGAPVLYARSLADAAAVALRSRGATPSLAPGSSTTGSMLKARVERLLARRTPRASAIWSGATTSVVAIAATVVIASRMPALVGFTLADLAVLPASMISATHLAATPSLEAPSMESPVAAPVFLLAVPTPSVGLSQSSPAPLPIVSEHALVTATTADVVVPEAPAIAPADHAPLAPLAASQLPHIMPASSVESGASEAPASGDTWLAQRFVSIGGAIADASVATGLGTARAGKAIGNFFSK